MRHAVLIAIALVSASACGACAVKQPQAPTATLPQLPAPKAEEAPVVPPMITPEPKKVGFSWTIEVRGPGEMKQYLPGGKPKKFEVFGDEWHCMTTKIDVKYARGAYAESLDVICALGDGHAVAGRTVCIIDSKGVVHEDRQVLVLVDADRTQQVLTMDCSEVEEDSDMVPQSDEPVSPAAPKTLSL